MNTNQFVMFDAISDVTASIFDSVSNGLDGASQAITNNDYAGSILGYLAAILVSLLVIWGLWYVIRRLMRAMRATGK